MAQNIVKFSNLGAQVKGQPFDLFMTFSSGLLLDPVLTGGTNVVWHWPDGVTTSTGTTPTPTLTAPGRYRVSMDDWRDLTAIDATDDALTCLEINGTMSNLATLTLTDNPSLEVDLIVDSIYGYRNSFPAMTVNIGGTCPDVAGSSIGKIGTLTASFGHTWTYNNSAFLFTVKTDNTGTSNTDQFTIPLPGAGTYDFIAYYDGQATAHTANTSLTLTMPSGAGTYGIAIVGVFQSIYFNNGGDKLKLTSVTQFGDVGWGSDWTGAFYGCSNMVYAMATDIDNATTGATSVENMLSGCLSITGPSLAFWNRTTPPTTTTNCYTGCTNLTDYKQIPTAYGGQGEPTASTAAYSVARRIYSSYSGSLIRVRRASDSAEQDIGFDGSGNLDTASLATFCSGTVGFVKTIYDQQGSNDATQTLIAQQPKIYDSVGGVIMENGKPAAAVDSINDYWDTGAILLTATGALSIFGVAQCDGQTNNGSRSIVSQFNTGSTGRTIFGIPPSPDIGPYQLVYFADGTDDVLVLSTIAFSTNQFLASVICSSSNDGEVYIDGQSDGSDTGTGVSRYARNTTIGGGPGTSEEHLNGKFQEVLIYQSDESDDESTIQININAYYGIY